MTIRTREDFVSLRGVIEIRMDYEDERDYAEPIDMMDCQEEFDVSQAKFTIFC